MRKVEGKYWIGTVQEYVIGYFHQWAATYEEFESGPGNDSVALIEDEKTGQIRKCIPETVIFLEEIKP